VIAEVFYDGCYSFGKGLAELDYLSATVFKMPKRL